MSQDECLRCLVHLGGSAKLDDLADEYNRIHFPRNVGYKDLTMNEVKKTLQGDTSKLMRNRLISRVYMRPSKRDAYKQHRKFGFYTITDRGWNYINQYKICEPIKIKNNNNERKL